MSAADAEPVASAGDGLGSALPRRGLAGRFAEWFWRRDALSLAVASERHTPKEREAFEIARSSLALGEHALASRDPAPDLGMVTRASAEVVAFRAFQDACYWALVARAGGEVPAESDAGALIDALDESALVALSRERLRAAATCQPRDVALLEPKERASELELLRAGARELLRSHARDPVWKEKQRRYLHLLVVCAVIALALGITVSKIRKRLHPDFGEKATWRASSAMGGHPGTGTGTSTKRSGTVFFHTAEEASPWIEIDLGQVRRISDIDILNRSDCCQERAVPLVVQIATQRGKWTEVGRQTQTFVDWDDKFAPADARYVRIQAERKTFLHLEHVEIH